MSNEFQRGEHQHLASAFERHVLLIEAIAQKQNMTSDFIPHLHTLHPSGQPFVVDTVVRAEKPTSAKAGAKLYIPLNDKLGGPIPIEGVM